jgi:aspartate-semialdehyde dehydrogenase
MTYQAASGAGANNMRELVAQMAALGRITEPLLADPASTALEIDRAVTDAQRGGQLPVQYFKHPLAGSLLPWIDKPVEHGQSREEWKGLVETNKILGLSPEVPVDGQCVRIGAMRCHSQGVTIKLRRNVPMDEITELIAGSNAWVRVVENTPEATLAQLTPTAVSGKLEVPIGRLRKMRIGPEYLTAFTVGDQLLWGAAEPLRRMLRILREHVAK